MMDGNSGLSVADAIALSRNGNCCNDGCGNGWGGDGSWIMFLFFLLIIGAWGGRGGYGWGGGANSPDFQGAATRADINEGFAFNGLQRDVDAIQHGICDSTYALNNTIQNGFANNQLQLCNGFNSVQQTMNNIGFQLQDCCCQTQRAFDGVNYNMATQTNALQNTMNNNTRDIIDNQNAGTRAILDYLCQDKIQTLQNENQSLRLAASQADQNAVLRAAMDANTAEIIRRTGNDCPVPAYVVPNPNCCYGNPIGVGYSGFGNGFGFFNNSGCGCNSCGC